MAKKKVTEVTGVALLTYDQYKAIEASLKKGRLDTKLIASMNVIPEWHTPTHIEIMRSGEELYSMYYKGTSETPLTVGVDDETVVQDRGLELN